MPEHRHFLLTMYFFGVILLETRSFNMAYTIREQQEKFLVSQIKWIMQIPQRDVYVLRWIDKSVVPATKITVFAGMHKFVLDEIPGNSYSIDVIVDGQKLWITSSECMAEITSIQNQLLQEYDEKTK